jgi:hypothetical protein
MIEDEVVREVRAAREVFAAAHGFDIARMVAALHELGIASGREVVRFAPRPAILRPTQPRQPTAPVSENSKPAEAAP